MDPKSPEVLPLKGERVIPRGGIPHTHSEFVEGCFRCDLSRDEMEDD